MDKNLITMNDLGFSYGKEEVLSIDTLSIGRNLTTVFIGDNGSGKTTLLKLLSGLLSPTRGSINRSSGELAENAVIVHQIPHLFSGTVKYNIEIGLKMKGIRLPAGSRIVKEVLMQVDLLPLLRRKTSQLSGGEKHRLALARAIAVDPDTLILDEPFAHIDPGSRKLIEKLIENRALSGKTTLLSTHDLTSAYRLADRIIYLQNGKICEPENNVFKGSVISRDDHFCKFRTLLPIIGPADAANIRTANKKTECHSEKQEVTILSPASTGDYRAAVIPFSDIFLSAEPIKTSAQNQMKGNVIALKQKGNQFIVTIDCGILLKAVITDLSVQELQIEENRQIYVNFKASAVKLY